MWPCNSISMRVQAPPLRCRGDSISPNSATGSQGVAAGINGEIWEPHLDRSLSKNLWAAIAKTCLSHRDCNPAKEAHTLEPKGTGYDAGSPSSDQWALSRNPVDSVALKVQTMEMGNGVTPQWLSESRVGANRMLLGRRMPEEAKAW